MLRTLLLLTPLLLVAACAAPDPPEPSQETETLSGDAAGDGMEATATADAGGAAGGVDDFVAACLASLNWDRALCTCVGEKARAELSADGYAFQVASLRGDDDETARLRAGFGPEEAMQAGLFMVNAPADCAGAGQ